MRRRTIIRFRSRSGSNEYKYKDGEESFMNDKMIVLEDKEETPPVKKVSMYSSDIKELKLRFESIFEDKERILTRYDNKIKNSTWLLCADSVGDDIFQELGDVADKLESAVEEFGLLISKIEKNPQKPVRTKHTTDRKSVV